MGEKRIIARLFFRRLSVVESISVGISMVGEWDGKFESVEGLSRGSMYQKWINENFYFIKLNFIFLK